MMSAPAFATSLPSEITDIGFRLESVSVRHKWQSTTDNTVGIFNVYGALAACEARPVKPLLYSKEVRDPVATDVMRIEIQILAEKKESSPSPCWDQKVLFGISFSFCKWPAEIKRAHLIHEGRLLKEYVLPEREYQCL